MKALFLLIFSCLCTLIFGQNPNTADSINQPQFDFWVGEWDVFSIDQQVGKSWQIEFRGLYKKI